MDCPSIGAADGVGALLEKRPELVYLALTCASSASCDSDDMGLPDLLVEHFVEWWITWCHR